MQSSVVGENVITDLRTILEEALDRIKTEIFGPEGEHPAGEPEAPAAPAPAPPSAEEGQDSPS
jgi:hypothetical protein